MITLMLNAYAEDPGPAIESAEKWLPSLARTIQCYGRYEGFPDLGPPDKVWPSEHAKRNYMLENLSYLEPSGSEWLLWLDCDERIVYASPQLEEQLVRVSDHAATIHFIEPLPPDPELWAGLKDPRRRFRDHHNTAFNGRLYRHVPGLEYRGRHDNLFVGDHQIVGWRRAGDAFVEVKPISQVDLIVMHRWWEQSPERREAKRTYYASATRRAETESV